MPSTTTRRRVPQQRRPAPYTPTGKRADQRNGLLESVPLLAGILVAVLVVVVVGVLLRVALHTAGEQLHRLSCPPPAAGQTAEASCR